MMKNQIEKQKIIGIDLHPDSFSAVYVTGHSLTDMKIIQRFTKVDCGEWERFLKNLPEKCTLVCESGNNSFEFMKRAKAFGHKAVVLDSVSTGKIAKAYCKNDPKDALRCAKIYLCGLAEQVWIPDQETAIRREIVSAYKQAVTDRTRCINRIKSFLTAHKVRLKKKSDISNSEIQGDIRKAYPWTDEQLFVLETMLDDFANAISRRRKYYRFIAETMFRNPEMMKLMRLCGIRLLSAYELLAAIGDIERFPNPKALVAYLGLAPTVYSSGSKSYSGGIQKGGKVSVKTTLVEAATSILKSKNASGAKLRKWGVALMMRKCKFVAVGGIARKLAVAVWYLLKGFMPDVFDVEKDIAAKLRSIASDLTLPFILALGYKNNKEFIQEYSLAILSTNPLRC